MASALQRLLIDHIRRGAWFWPLVAFLQVTAVFSYALSRPTTAAVTYPMMGALFAPMILGVAEQRGWLQLLMTLPLSRRDIARADWWAAIGLPGVFLTVLSLAVVAVFTALGWAMRPAWQIGLWLLTGWAILGLFAQARSWLRVRSGETLSVTRYAVAAIYVAIAIPLLFFAGAGGYRQFLVLGATAAGLLIDAYRYWRAEHLLLWRIGRGRVAGMALGKQPAPSSAGEIGWRVLAERWALRLAVFAGLVALGLSLFAIIADADMHLFQVLCMSFMGLMVVLSSFLASPWLSAARAFRALPLSADRLAAVFLAMTAAPAWTLLLILCATVLLFPAVPLNVFAPVGLLSIAMTSLVGPILLRLGPKGVSWIAVAIIVPSPVLDPMLTIFHPDLVERWIGAWVSAVTALAAAVGYLSFLWMRHELRVGRGAYRRAPLGSDVAA
jgi:hypothetical protein